MNLLTTVAATAAVAQDSLMVLTEPVQESINVLDMAVKGGWIMVVLALLSIVGVYVFFERLAVIRGAMKKNPYMMDRLHDNLKDKDVKSALNYCHKQGTPLSRVLEKGIKAYEFSTAYIRKAMDNSAGFEIAKLEKGFPVLSTIAAVGPMIGFLGTVTGMVQAFWEMSNAGNNIDVSLLAGGIYEAMVTTVGGLIVGIVSIFAYNYLVSLVDKVQNDIEGEIIAFIEIASELKEKNNPSSAEK